MVLMVRSMILTGEEREREEQHVWIMRNVSCALFQHL
jgi:hypothetical protein